MNHKLFYQNALWQYGLQAVKYILPLLTLPYLTRVLQPDGYAVVAYVTAFMTFAQVFVDFGFNLSGTKKVAAARGDAAEAGRVAGAITQARLLLCVSAGVVVAIVTVLLPIARENPVYVALAYLVVCGRALAPDFLFQGNEDMSPLTTRYLVSKGASTALTFVFVQSPADLLWVPALDILASVVALVWSFSVAKRRFGVRLARVPLRESLAELKVSGLYGLSNMASVVFTGFTTLLVGVVADAHDVDYWSLSATAVSAVQSLFTPIINSLYPHMVKGADLSFVRRIALLAGVPLLLGTAAFALLSRPIMAVLGGEAYMEGSDVLIWVSPVLPLSFYAMLLGWPVLGAFGRVGAVTRSTVVSALFCTVSLLVLSIAGCATLPAICAIRCATEAVLCGTRAWACRGLL